MSELKTLDTDTHFRRLADLLKIESTSEARLIVERGQRLSSAAAERLGTALVELVVREEDVGLGGRLSLTLTKTKASRPLPWTRLSVGAPILFTAEDRQRSVSIRGIVQSRQESAIRISVPYLPEEADEVTSWRVDLSSDEIARDRQLNAMERAQAAKGNRLAQLRDVLLGQREPRILKPPKVPPQLDPRLNPSQVAAVELALEAEDLAILHGPPGTGKTTVVAEVIRQLVARGEKVLACAPSNLAVDNLLERVLALGIPAIRLGNPIRVTPRLRERTLDALVEDHGDVRLANKLSKEAYALFRKAARWSRAKPEPGSRDEMRREAKQLLADARQLERGAITHVIDMAPVVCATTTGLDSELLGKRTFDCAVIDEACQTTEPGCWPPITYASRIILAGDHCQLPPTVVSKEAENGGLGVSLMERLVAHHGAQITRRIDVQYRMHEDIMNFSSSEFYDCALVADESVKSHRLSDLPNVEAFDPQNLPLEFIDTAGAGYEEEPDGDSRRNESEAKLVAKKVQELLDIGVPAVDIAVIAPYSAQVRRLRDLLAEFPSVEVDSVDGFQGREKEVIVFSCVRSNSKGEIGFLQEIRRTNVAMTRARRKLLVIGDSATLANHPFYARLLEYAESVGGYRTVWEEL